MPADLIRYDLLVQDALLGVVRKVLADTARDGLLGDHHFYVTFRTTAPGVRLSQRMRERYPEEMTIILQHQFWDLEVNELAFQVGLSFGGSAELLVIPYEAVTGFFDPSVQFGLKFEVQDMAPEAGANDTAPARMALQKPAAKPSKMGDTARTPPRGAGAEPTITPPKQPAAASGKVAAASQPPANKPDEAPAAAAAGSEAKIVSIDSFRKKP